MSDIYPAESQNLDLVGHLEEIRRRLWVCLATVTVSGVLFFTQREWVISVVKRPLNGLPAKLIFIGPAEAFSAYVILVLVFGIVVSMPMIIYQVWAFIAPAVTREARKKVVFWLLTAFLLFYTGILFAYYMAIPAALIFLIDFGKTMAEPNITLEKYISFFSFFTLLSGLIFEIPIVMALLGDIGILHAKALRRLRHYAFVIILIAAAVITPTQDIFNLFLFAAPMYLLYEAGIILCALTEKNQKAKAAKTAESE